VRPSVEYNIVIGRSVANFEILELVGLGGSGDVYRALDLSRQREVALKILSERAEPDAVRRFVREAEALAELRHPHIVEVYGSGVDQGLRFIAMELMPGATLRERLQGVAAGGGKLPWREAVSIARQVATALAHAHSRGIVHRDVKPGNVMFDLEGKAKLADFGLAHVSDASAMTRTGTVMGTVLYLAPEQAVGRAVDARSDLYALGCVLYEMVVGQPPFTGPSAVSVIYKHLNEQPPRLRQVDATLPPALETIVDRLLHKDPERRFPSADELVNALDLLLDGETEAASVPALQDVPANRGESLLPLAGRDAELAALSEALDGAVAALGRTVILAGEAGMGKTRLVRELARVAAERNALVLVGECLYGDAPNPYAPFAEMVRAHDVRRQAWAEADPDIEGALRGIGDICGATRVGADSDDALPDDEQWLSRLQRQHISLQDAQGQAFERISSYFLHVSRKRPLVLVLDDLQWASPTTLQLFHYLARSVRGARVLLIGTYRPEELLPGAASGRHPLREVLQRMGREHLYEEIRLGALDAEAVGALAAAYMNAPAPDEDFGALLHRESAGNPLYLLETLQLLQTQGALERVEDHWELAEALENLQVPSTVLDVIMRRVEHISDDDRELLEWAAIAGQRIDAPLLAIILGRSPLEVMRRLYLLEQRHGLVTTYEGDASSGGFAFANTKIREVLYEQMPAPLRRESHLRVGEALEQQCAGQEEERIYDLAHHFVRAQHAEKGYRYALRAAERAEAHYALAEAIAYLDDALSMRSLAAGEPGAQAPERISEDIALHHRRGRLLSTVGRLDESMAALEAALAASRGPLGAVTLPPGQRAPLARIEAEILLDLAAVHGRSGAWDRAVALADETLRLAEELGDAERQASALLSSAYFIFERGDWEGALHRLHTALAVAQEHGLELLQARILGNMAIMHNARGDRAKAVELYQGSIDTFQRLDQPLDVGRGLSNMGFSYYGLQAHDQAEACYRRALELFEKVGDVREQGLVYLHLAEVALALGALDAARAHCTQAMRRFSRLGFELGMADVDRVHAGIARREQRWAVAEHYLREALAVYEDYGDQLNLAETHEELGRLLADGGQAQKSAEELERSRIIYHTLSGAATPADA